MAAGERFCPVFPLAGTMYVPVCFPAFQPDQCICKEEEEVRLKSIHNGATLEAIEVPVHSYDTNYQEVVIFHMTQHELYEIVATSVEVYYPPTLRLTV